MRSIMLYLRCKIFLGSDLSEDDNRTEYTGPFRARDKAEDCLISMISRMDILSVRIVDENDQEYY